MTNLEIPAQTIVDNLRNEIARLNDERLTLSIKLDYANKVIAAYEAQAEQMAPATEEQETA